MKKISLNELYKVDWHGLAKKLLKEEDEVEIRMANKVMPIS